MTQEYIINVTKIEELQTINDRDELEAIFDKARRSVVGGGAVLLVRKDSNGQTSKFDELTAEADLEAYREQVLKYVKE